MSTRERGELSVLWLIKGLGPGGAERLLVNQARTSGGGIDYQAAYLVPTKDQLVPELEAAGVPCRCLGSGRDTDLRWLARLRRVLVDERIDVVHVHSPWPAAWARPVVHSCGRRRPALVSTEHNRWAQYAPVTRMANRLTYRLDDLRVAVSEGVRASVSPHARRDLIPLVHGIDVAATAAHRSARDAVRAAWGVGPDIVVIGTVANLRAEKAYPDLLEAAASLDPSLPVLFVAVGQGPLEAELHARHRALGLGDRFRFLGYQPDAARAMAGFDVFTLSSHHEGLPVALMEAQALGLPVVATAVGGVPEVVVDGVHGRLVPPGRPHDLAAALEAVALDPDGRAAWGAAAGAAAGRFDMRVATAQLEGWYHELARGRS